MRNGEGGTVPSYNVQLVTDTTHGLVVDVEATTDAIDYRQLEPALDRCKDTLGRLPKQIVADGDYTNHASVQGAAASGVDFYGSWQDSWKPTEHDAQGRSGAFVSSAFPYDAEHDIYLCPAGQQLHHKTVLNRGNGVLTHLYKAPAAACCSCVYVTNVLPRNRDPNGGGSSRASSNPPRRSTSRPRWRPKRQSKSTGNDRRSLSSRMPESKSDVDSGNFDAEDKRRHRWKLLGLVLVTTSSGGSAYGASSMPYSPPRGGSESLNLPVGAASNQNSCAGLL